MTEILITTLNKRKDIADLHKVDPDATDLSLAEKQLFEQYKPGNTLIVYGSLAPGKSNHAALAHIKGNWLPAIIRGQLENKGWAAGAGFPAFRPAPADAAEVIDAWVLIAENLPDSWNALDQFEGDEYRRILAEYESGNGEKGIGYIYGLNE